MLPEEEDGIFFCPRRGKCRAQRGEGGEATDEAALFQSDVG
jgi:hypothetical protein